MKKYLTFFMLLYAAALWGQSDTTSTPPQAWRVTWPDGFGGKILVDTGVKLDTIYPRPVALRRKKK